MIQQTKRVQRRDGKGPYPSPFLAIPIELRRVDDALGGPLDRAAFHTHPRRFGVYSLNRLRSLLSIFSDTPPHLVRPSDLLRTDLS